LIEKAAFEMLVNWTSIVNFTLILRSTFALISFCQQITKINFERIKDSKKLLCTKKLLVKCWLNKRFTWRCLPRKTSNEHFSGKEKRKRNKTVVIII